MIRYEYHYFAKLTGHHSLLHLVSIEKHVLSSDSFSSISMVNGIACKLINWFLLLERAYCVYDTQRHCSIFLSVFALSASTNQYNLDAKMVVCGRIVILKNIDIHSFSISALGGL